MYKENKKEGSSPLFYTVKILSFLFFARMRKGLGNKGFPNWNPQPEFIFDEEKPKFQGN